MLGLVAFLSSLKFWRDSKRSPYFFMRQQATRRMQSYLSIFAVLMLLAIATGVYGWRPPQDTTTRMALLSYAKPAPQAIRELMEQPSAAELAQTSTTTPTMIQSGGIANILLNADEASSFSSELPAAYDRVEPKVKLNKGTSLGTVVFSSTVTEEYQAISPTTLFGQGFYTLYATFHYEEMADGMAWSWVWRHNGKVIDGGNELWAYGDEGPGYIYLRPEEGFGEGRYTLEIWVNGTLLGQASATMNNAAISAGN